MLLEDFKDKGIQVPKDILVKLLYEPRENAQTPPNTSKD